ncbi:MAG: LacI family DNA-binding transcriptional regulator [Caulobacterales bacterium]|nr:LacI family DNA-binding transcriptional regulator [Caulobacterales bacterium]
MTSAARRPATLQDIAERAGVSKQTVSRVANGSALVGEATRARISAMIAEADYHPDPQAQALARGRSAQVALVYENPNPQHILTIQQGLLEGLDAAGLCLILHPCRQGSPTFLADLEAFVLRQKLAGVVLPPPLSEDEAIAERLRQIGCPYVRMAAVALDAPERVVVGHDRLGARAAMRHIVGLGHRRVGFVNGPAGFRSSAERRAGVLEALGERGLALDPAHEAPGGYTFDSGVAAGRRLLDRATAERPTAIFAANDEMAAGVLRVAQELGLAVPADLTIVGFDDFDIASRVWPPLTTIRTPTHEAARTAAQKLQPGGADRRFPEVAPKLVVRGSCGPPAGAPSDGA